MKKMIVLCPAATVSPSAQALHRLVATAADLGADASILYLPEFPSVTPAYEHFGVTVSDQVPIQPGVVVVVPESAVQFVPLEPSLAQWAMWWLEVDDFYTGFGGRGSWMQHDPDVLTRLLSPELGVSHLAQHAEAHEFLTARGTRPRPLHAPGFEEAQDVSADAELTFRSQVGIFLASTRKVRLNGHRPGRRPARRR